MRLPGTSRALNYKRYVEFVPDPRELDREAFDRLRYAARVLSILAPRVTVALCPGADRLRVEEGGAPERTGGRWAIVSIPTDASRAHIALALARLAGRAADPYMLDVLLAARP